MKTLEKSNQLEDYSYLRPKSRVSEEFYDAVIKSRDEIAGTTGIEKVHALTTQTNKLSKSANDDFAELMEAIRKNQALNNFTPSKN